MKLTALTYPTKFSVRPLFAVAVIAIGMLLTPEIRAVICSNGGAGSNPAGSDSGVTTNTVCGEGAVATGSDATAIGAASSSTAGGIAIGHRATQTGLRAIAIGTDAGSSNTPAGIGAQAVGQESVALGPDAFTSAFGAQAYWLRARPT